MTTFRDKHTMPFQVHHSMYSCKYKTKSEVNTHKQSFSSDNGEYQIINFNSGKVQRNSQSSPEEDLNQTSSDNETQNFIRAEFNKKPIKLQENFKQYYQNINQNQDYQVSKIHDNQVKKYQNSQKKFQQKIFLDVKIEKDSNKSNESKNQIKKTQIKELTSHLPNKEIFADQSQSVKPSYRYSKLEQIQTVIMKTLQKKERQISYIQAELTALSEQKLFQFHTNRELQKQFSLLKKKSLQIESINKNTFQNPEWKPQNLQQMKLSIQNQNLLQELARLEAEEQKLKDMLQQMSQQQKVMKEGLRITFKARKQLVQGMTWNDRNQQINKSKYILQAPRAQIYRNTLHPQRISNQGSLQSSKTLIQRIRGNNDSTFGVMNKKQKYRQSSQRLSNLQQKQLLIKLIKDFSQLKNKVDESLMIKSKTKHQIKNSKSNENKSNKRVVFINTQN